MKTPDSLAEFVDEDGDRLNVIQFNTGKIDLQVECFTTGDFAQYHLSLEQAKKLGELLIEKSEQG